MSFTTAFLFYIEIIKTISSLPTAYCPGYNKYKTPRNIDITYIQIKESQKPL